MLLDPAGTMTLVHGGGPIAAMHAMGQKLLKKADYDIKNSSRDVVAKMSKEKHCCKKAQKGRETKEE